MLANATGSSTEPQTRFPLTWPQLGAAAVVLLTLALLLPQWTGRGLFFDGALYAGVAANLAASLAEGTGSPFAIHASDAPFALQPPLFIWTQTLFFRLLGTHFWVEKLFGALCVLAFALLMAHLTRWTLRRDEQSISASAAFALPLLLLMLHPQANWIAGNVLYETPQAMLCLAAVACGIRALDAAHGWRWALACGLLCFAAVYGKGPVGLFPLAVPGLAAVANSLTTRRDSLGLCSWPRGLMLTGIAVAGAALGFALLYMVSPAREQFDRYLQGQVAQSVAGIARDYPTYSGWGRLHILERLLAELAVPLGAVLLWALARGAGWRHRLSRVWSAELVFVLLLALAASLPLTLSSTQYDRYLFPSQTLYAIALAALAWRIAQQLPPVRLSPTSDRRLRLATSVGLAAALIALVTYCVLNFGRPHRDRALQADLAALAPHLPLQARVAGLHPDMERAYELKAYLLRERRIYLALAYAPTAELCLAPLPTGAEVADSLPGGWRRVAAPTTLYALYRRQP